MQNLKNSENSRTSTHSPLTSAQNTMQAQTPMQTENQQNEIGLEYSNERDRAMQNRRVK